MEWESLCADVAGDDDAEPRDGSFAACFIAEESGVLAVARLACRERREEGGCGGYQWRGSRGRVEAYIDTPAVWSHWILDGVISADASSAAV